MFNQEEKNPLNQSQAMPAHGIEGGTRESGTEKPPVDSYWWHAPWGEVKRVTRSQQRELMRQWLESGK
jgi:hypothetical protein